LMKTTSAMFRTSQSAGASTEHIQVHIQSF